MAIAINEAPQQQMPGNKETIDRQDKRRIAVIAFHGVADQKPRETAQAIAGMLLSLRDDNRARIYSDFREAELRLPVEPVFEPSGTARLEAASAEQTSWKDYFKLDPRTESFKELHGQNKGTTPAAERIKNALATNQSIVEAEDTTAPDTLDHQYMREQLQDYKPAEADRIYKTSDSVYETTQLTGFRVAGGASSAAPEKSEKCEIHIYEMYWADLSRVGSDWLRVLIDFYQLLAYLCGVGRKTLYFAQAESHHSTWWEWFRKSQLGSECMLTLAIPVINLCLLALAMIVLPFQLPAAKHQFVGVAIGSAFGAVVVGWILHCKRELFPFNAWPWLLSILLTVGALAAALGCLLSAKHTYLFYSLLALGWWLVLAVLVCWMMKRYNRRRTGAFVTGVGFVLLLSAIYLTELWRYQNKDTITIGNAILAAASETALVICIVLGVVWFLFLLFTLFTSLFGFFVTKLGCASAVQSDKDAVRRAVWTVNLTLILPGTLTLFANLAVWKALELALRKLSDHTIVLHPWLPFAIPPEVNSTKAVMNRMIESFASGWFMIFVIAFAFCALIAVWSVLPALFGKNEVVVDPLPDKTKAELVKRSLWLGQVLSKGYRALRFSGELLRVFLFCGFITLFSLVCYCHFSGWTFPDYLNHPGVLSAFGLIFLLMLTASQGPFRFLALGFRSAIDIALDVANWLRSNPRDANPKARITARCVSQLNYLADWRDPRDGGRYDAFVIIAHSQGTVIVSEILRFLQVETQASAKEEFGGRENVAKLREDVVAKLRDRKLYFFTMGCPLRQLYSLRFPHQYAWARHNATQWAGKDPDPKHLGIAEWVNAYRSGDYIGRYLWHPDTDAKAWDLEVRTMAGSYARREFCIGAGDHTHYWDKTAPKIAKELDRLINDACGTLDSTSPQTGL